MKSIRYFIFYFNKCFALAAVFLCSQMANAAVVIETYTGEIVVAEATNDYGLSDFDPITLTVTYDDSSINIGGTGDDFTFDFLSDPISIALDLNGLFSMFIPSLDVDFAVAPGDATINYFDGALTSVDLLVFDITNPDPFLEFTMTGDGFTLTDTQDFLIDGTFNNFQDVSVAAVPVPAALPLLGSGLVALFGFSRRKAKSS